MSYKSIFFIVYNLYNNELYKQILQYINTNI